MCLLLSGPLCPWPSSPAYGLSVTPSLQGSWKPSLNLSIVLLSIRLLMAEPNPDDGLVPDLVSWAFGGWVERFMHPSNRPSSCGSLFRQRSSCPIERHSVPGQGSTRSDMQ